MNPIKKNWKAIKIEIEYLKTDLMRDVLWPLYHKWILHKGKYGIREWLANCGHLNPYHILTPRLLKRQFKNAEKIEL